MEEDAGFAKGRRKRHGWEFLLKNEKIAMAMCRVLPERAAKFAGMFAGIRRASPEMVKNGIRGKRFFD